MKIQKSESAPETQHQVHDVVGGDSHGSGPEAGRGGGGAHLTTLLRYLYCTTFILYHTYIEQ